MMRASLSVRRLTWTALGVVINVICPFVSLSLRLPLLMDSIGTVLVSARLGPRCGVMAGVGGALISGLLFDVYSFYYAPVQILTALTAAKIMNSPWGRGRRCPAGALAVSLPTALVSAWITAKVFGGLTSSSTSYAVVLLQKWGMGLTAACFSVQIVLEYFDKLTAMVLARLIIRKEGEWSHGSLQ